MADDDLFTKICCGCLLLAVVGGMITGDSYRAGQAAAGLFWMIVIIILLISGIVAVYKWIKKKASFQNPPQSSQRSPGVLSGSDPKPVIPDKPRITPSSASVTSQFCIHCGNRVQKSQNFCNNCGKNPDK
jgi:hypothetical protein